MTMNRIDTSADFRTLPSRVIPLVDSAAHGVQHGGPDAGGVPVHDFSTNSNACGPCPEALRAVQSADPTRYPDPAYTALRHALGAFHGVAAHRIVVAGSASEFIHRITTLAVHRDARTVALPAHSYGDYAHAAQVNGLRQLLPGDCGHGDASLQWACEPSSPLGLPDPAWTAWNSERALRALLDEPVSDFEKPLRVLDCAYAPLRFSLGVEKPLNTADRSNVDARQPVVWGVPEVPGTWQLWTPNKALGLTGVRAAYAIAPHADAANRLMALAPSWPAGAHGVAMLAAWLQPSVQRWLADVLPLLQGWKLRQQVLCSALDWVECEGSTANFFCVRPPQERLSERLSFLRAAGIKVRECSSFGLSGVLRLGVLAPSSQDALQKFWLEACRAIPSARNRS